jgi:hypothetical protein
MFRLALLLLSSISVVLVVVNFSMNFKTFSTKIKFKPKDLAMLVDNPLELINADFYTKITNYELKDWHDYEFMRYEASRIGLGENGKGINLTDPEDIRKNNELFEIEGLSAHISDVISVNRSVPDVRNEL